MCIRRFLFDKNERPSTGWWRGPEAGVSCRPMWRMAARCENVPHVISIARSMSAAILATQRESVALAGLTLLLFFNERLLSEGKFIIA